MNIFHCSVHLFLPCIILKILEKDVNSFSPLMLNVSLISICNIVYPFDNTINDLLFFYKMG